MVDLVHECLQRGGGREAAEACAELISVSAARWRQYEGAYRDDISCIVLRLPWFASLDGGGGRGARAAAAVAVAGPATGDGGAAINPALGGVAEQGEGEAEEESAPV